MHHNNRRLKRFVSTLLVLVIAVVGPVQGAAHTSMMASQYLAGIHHPASPNTDASASVLHQHKAAHHPAITPLTEHTHHDSPCAELCVQASLIPKTNIAPDVRTTTTALSITAGVPLRLAEPAVPPPRNLF
ncbi:hypothetical protein ACFOSD_01375 [Salinispirillum marinum]|uniref:Uncharacterized protein n=2 Tax=Saccharospirillaceae TaxID=255527 RepID=A0ABV8BA02_9GAMM